LAEIELAAIAARLSLEAGGVEVALADIPESASGYDGAAFGLSYRNKARGK
jgi:hypothetical protein